MLCHAQSLQFEFRATCGRLSSRAHHHQSFRNNRRVSIIILYYICTCILKYYYIGVRLLLHKIVMRVLRWKTIKSLRCETTILWRHNLFSPDKIEFHVYLRTINNNTIYYIHRHYTISGIRIICYTFVAAVQHNRKSG